MAVQDFLPDLQSQSPTCRRGEGFADQLQIRPEEGSLAGRAVPYGHTVELLPGLFERFEPGTFSRQLKDPGRVKVCLEHGQVVGRAGSLEERQDGLYFAGKVSGNQDIPEAKRARALLGEDLVDELSIGFVTVPGGSSFEPQEDGSTLVVHSRARLLEISLVPWGVYGREATVRRSRLLDPAVAALQSHREARREWLRAYQARNGLVARPGASQGESP